VTVGAEESLQHGQTSDYNIVHQTSYLGRVGRTYRWIRCRSTDLFLPYVGIVISGRFNDQMWLLWQVSLQEMTLHDVFCRMCLVAEEYRQGTALSGVVGRAV